MPADPKMNLFFLFQRGGKEREDGDPEGEDLFTVSTLMEAGCVDDKMEGDF